MRDVLAMAEPEREHGWLAPQDLRSRDRRQSHRLDLDLGARLIGVDLQEHLADTQGRPLVMGDDDLNFFHVGHYRGMIIDGRPGFSACESKRAVAHRQATWPTRAHR
jgi:hypothetical protein